MTIANVRRRPCLTWGAAQDAGCSMLLACGSSIITGLDLVDVTLPEVATTETIHFCRGKLSIFFPYGSPPTKGESRDSLDLDLKAGGFDEADDTSDNNEWADANSTFMSDRGSYHSSSNDTQTSPPQVNTERMLGEKYGIHPRPSEFILDLLEDIFGTGCTKKMNGYDLKIAPFDPSVDEKQRRESKRFEQAKQKERHASDGRQVDGTVLRASLRRLRGYARIPKRDSLRRKKGANLSKPGTLKPIDQVLEPMTGTTKEKRQRRR
ncbi:hypothetical protein K443DRAFT_5671 [Laccaria amethystina LaAM-08-1]|uniref:Uncharacterized protein n=1 Tax=Laccaria amethystina LaAM-08-1 TaxID=1095629 RepID=A0A0C9Y4T0_9AGAR|nr:hypothetical protein K443DRAFT_5671 [Laccaria amethystina LaAM-08-1]